MRIGNSIHAAWLLFVVSKLGFAVGSPQDARNENDGTHTRSFGAPDSRESHAYSFDAVHRESHKPLSGVQGTRKHRSSHVGIDIDESKHAAGSPNGEHILTFTSSNEYSRVSWSPWPHIAEPYKKTKLKADSIIGNPNEDIFTWSLPAEGGVVYEGREVTHTFETVGRKPLVLTQTVRETGKSFHLHGSIMVKYVRREIRQLTDTDREAFFDAMETLYRLPTSEGNALFGDGYKGIDFFVQMHLDGAGVKDCDHWHDDAGIMTHHVGYTLQFEQALQLVDPSVSIPYWEYTIEAATGLSMYGESDIFTADWFGDASPGNPMHTVDKGRWSYLPVMQDAWDYVHNSYGLLRTPWNMDSTPFVTRHNMTNGVVASDLVDCSALDSCFKSDTLASMNNCLNGGTHGPVHILIGGEWADPEREFIVKTGYGSATPLVMKFLWRKGYLRYPDKCEIPTDSNNRATCKTFCPAELYQSRGMTPYDVLMDVHAMYWIAGFSQGVLAWDDEEQKFHIAGHKDDEAFSNAFWQKMLDSFCNPGHLGEMYTSSAPYDPVFWVIHPAAERFLGWRRMLARSNSDDWAFDETWGYKHGNVVGESGTVCDWSGVRPNSLDMPNCVLGICGGHKYGDLLPFDIKVNGREVKMTNADWLNFIYPTNEDLPYMYNEFRWDHCALQGYDMGTAP